jgi:uncharacterized membrane protein
MQLTALTVAVVSALLYAAVAIVSGEAARRLEARRGSLILLAGALVLGLVLVPPPLVLLARAGYIEVTDPGHAGINFMGPYVLLGLASIVAALVVANRRKNRS